jgi:N-dimethylarginine dimethylaminohydrolase
MNISQQSDIAAIGSVLIKHARDAFVSQETCDSQWQQLNYKARPDFAKAVDEYDGFVEILRNSDIDIHFLSLDNRVGLDSIYTRDASVACSRGVILCNMGKSARRTEPSAQEAAYREMEIPIIGAISGDGQVEGGDVVWIDRRTLAVGRGYRTNDEGIRQLRTLLGGCIDELIVVPLPHWRGPGDVFHLMSIISPIDHNLALVYSPLLAVPFRETLLERGYELVEVPDSEFESMGCNVLALALRKCIVLAGNPQTKSRLEQAGVEICEYEGLEISLKGGGGPTCLTRPIVRSD